MASYDNSAFRRSATGRALVGVVLAELIASNQGIGHMISVAGSTLNTGRLMLGVLLPDGCGGQKRVTVPGAGQQ